jgi:hypothetical protein
MASGRTAPKGRTHGRTDPSLPLRFSLPTRSRPHMALLRGTKSTDGFPLSRKREIEPTSPNDTPLLEQSEFYVADAAAILASDPTVALYVAAILARRLDAANRWLVAVKRQVQTGEPPSVIGKAVEKVEELLSYGGRDPTGW